MLEEAVKSIMKSPSVERLEGFPLEDVQKYLMSLHDETEEFVNLLEGFEYELTCDKEKRTLEIGAQLDNLRVNDRVPIRTQLKHRRLLHRHGLGEPINYAGLALTLNRDTKSILKNATVNYSEEGKPFSPSFIGAVTETDDVPRHGIVKRVSPLLLVSHESSPEIGKVVHSILRTGSSKWEPLPKGAYEMALESKMLSSEQALGYIS